VVDLDTFNDNATALVVSLTDAFAKLSNLDAFVQVAGGNLTVLANNSAAINLLAQIEALSSLALNFRAHINTTNKKIEQNFGAWMFADTGEAIAVDIPFDVFASNQLGNSAAFVEAIAHVLGLPTASVTVTSFQVSTVGTTKIFFNLLLTTTTDSTSSAVITAASASIADFFNGKDAGSPANATLVHAFNRFGLQLTSAFYNDQIALSSPPPPPPSHLPSGGRRLYSSRRTRLF